MKTFLNFVAFLFSVSLANANPVACGLPDDTQTVQAQLDATQTVELPSGICRICSLNATNRQPTIKGQGMSSYIIPICGGANVIDLTGSSHKLLQDFHMSSMFSTLVPKIGILDAQMQGSMSSDVTRIENVRVDGVFSIAAHYDLGVASSMIIGSQFYNSYPSAPTVVHTGNNVFGAVSAFVQINNANDQGPVDWSFFQTEIHNFGNGTPLWLGGSGSLRFFGGNISGNITQVSINAVPGPGGNIYPTSLSFFGTVMYSDSPPSPACNVQNNAGSGGLPHFFGYSTGPVMCP